MLAHHSQLQIPCCRGVFHAFEAHVYVQNVRPIAADVDHVLLFGQIHPMSAVDALEPERSAARDV